MPDDRNGVRSQKGGSVVSHSRRAWIAGLVGLLLGSTGSVQAEEAGLSVPVWFATELSIAPDEAEGIWRCEALLKDLGSQEVLSAPTVVFAAGESATVTSGLTSEMLWELDVEVSSDGRQAKWTSRISIGDQILSLSEGNVRLNRE